MEKSKHEKCCIINCRSSICGNIVGGQGNLICVSTIGVYGCESAITHQSKSRCGAIWLVNNSGISEGTNMWTQEPIL